MGWERRRRRRVGGEEEEEEEEKGKGECLESLSVGDRGKMTEVPSLPPLSPFPSLASFS